MRLVRIAAVVGGAGLIMAAATPAALAGGNGAQTFTQHRHDFTRTHKGRNPCTGDRGMLTTTVNEVFHGTINKTGSWFTGTVEGQFTFVPTDPAAIAYTGHFATWFGDENNLRNSVEHSTFNVHGVGTDGSRLTFHDNAQAVVNANGVVTVNFNHMRCG